MSGKPFPRPHWHGVYRAIHERRDVRSQFLPDPVPPAVLARLFEAAHHAPSVGFMQPWDFIVIEQRAVRDEIKALFDQENARAAGNYDGEDRTRYTRLKLEGITDAPVNVCITCDRERGGPHVLGRNTVLETDLFSACLAVQNLWLAARAEGVGVGWVSILDPDDLARVLGLPDSVYPLAYLCLGYVSEFLDEPELQAKGWRSRLPLPDLVHAERWGHSLSEGPLRDALADPTPAHEAAGLPATLMRGGSSKGLFFHHAVVPSEPRTRDAALQSALGSPDPFGRQMDGVGAGTSSASKVALIRPSETTTHDLDYAFGHVDVTRPVIDWSGTCGNLTAAVGPWAVEEGLLRPADGWVEVRIHAVNTGATLLNRFEVCDGMPVVHGDCRVDGVPGTGAPVELGFVNPGRGGEVLPTGRPVDRLELPGGETVEVTLVDAGNPAVFVAAEALGCTATEHPEAIDADPELMARLEAIRASAAVRLGLAATPEEATQKRPATPKVSVVGPARGYTSTAGAWIASEAVDLCARILSMGRAHHAYTGTGAVALAAAAALPGTVPARCLASPPRRAATVRLRVGHAAGTLEAGAEVADSEDDPDTDARIACVTLVRTARRLMDGVVYPRPTDWTVGHP